MPSAEPERAQGPDAAPPADRVIVVAGDDGRSAARQAGALADGTGCRTAVWVGTHDEPGLAEMCAEIGAAIGEVIRSPIRSGAHGAIGDEAGADPGPQG